jgi:hypothetical protein
MNQLRISQCTVERQNSYYCLTKPDSMLFGTWMKVNYYVYKVTSSQLAIYGIVRRQHAGMSNHKKWKYSSAWNRPRRPKVSKGIALLYNLGARWSGWLTPRPGRFTPGRDSVPGVQEAGWATGPVWTVAENLAPTGIRSPDRPARSNPYTDWATPGHLVYRHEP